MKKILFIWSIALSSIYSFAGEVTGVVKDLTSNKVVDNGTVTIYNSGSRRTTQIQINGDYSFTGISATFEVSITSPIHWDCFTNTQYGLLLVITTNILFLLNTFVSVSSKYTPFSIVFLFVITKDPGLSITLLGVSILHFTLMW